ncbi:MAG: glycosyltransferase family 2 protein [Phycisphaerae bacterium]
MGEPPLSFEPTRIRVERRRFQRPVVVLPAYNAATTLAATVADIPRDAVAEIILCDDCSRDDTLAIARRLGLLVLQHDRNRGYGANQKSCYDAACARGADVVVMLHPDYQYDGRLIPAFLAVLETGVCDIMLGNRVRTRREALAGGMPAWKYAANRALTLIENVGMGQNLGDFHSGFRVFTREVLDALPYPRFSDDFVFDTQFLAAAAALGFRIGDAPMPCRYFHEASSINFRRSCRYGLTTLWTVARFNLHRLGAWRCPLFVRRQERALSAAPPATDGASSARLPAASATPAGRPASDR